VSEESGDRAIGSSGDFAASITRSPDQPISRFSLSSRQFHREHRTPPRPIGSAHFPPVELDQMLDDGEPEAGSAGVSAFARARFVDAVEAFEDARQVALRNTGALV
jgi:hypothetical protein